MTATPNAATIAAVRRVVREEMLCAPAQPETLPLPTALDDEQDIASALIGGYAKASELPALRAEHFYSELFAATFAICDSAEDVGAKPSVELVARALEAQGIGGAELHDELVRLRDWTPYRCLASLQRSAALVVELWQRRQLIGAMQQLDIELRAGAKSFAEAVNALTSSFETAGEDRG